MQQPVAVPPRPQSLAALPSVRPTLVSPGHFTLLPPSAQYVCQPPVPLPSPYRLVGAHGQELPISGLTYQLIAPQPHPVSGAAVQLIPAAPVAEVYSASQHAAYLQPDSVVHSATAAAAESEPVVHLSVHPKSGTTVFVDPGYQVIQPSAGDGSLSYAIPSCEMPQPQPAQQQIVRPSSSLPTAASSSRPYEDSPEYYPPQSTLLMTSLHPAGSRPVLTGSLRQPLPVIISGKLVILRNNSGTFKGLALALALA